MSSVIVAGDTSGSVTLQAPAEAGTTVLTLPTTSGTVVVNNGAQTIEFADGSASAPSITNSGDTNTGMFFPAADTIAFSEGGTEAMRINSSGNVGIGVTPSAWVSTSKALQIKSYSSLYESTTGQTTLAFNTYESSSGVYKAIQTEASNRILLVSGATYFQSAPSVTAGATQTFTTAMTLDASGNLGIGTASPTQKLEVTGTILAKAAGNSGRFDAIDSTASGATITLNAAFSGTGLPAVQTQTNHPILFAPNNTERMRLDSSGNLGLGVSPSAWGSGFKAQQIGSSLSLWGTPTASSNAGMMTNTYINSAGNNIYISSSYAAHYQQYQGGHYWLTAASGTAGTTATFTERMVLDINGNLSGTNIAATFTPTLVSNVADEISYNGTGQVLTGAYTRISKVVTLSIKYTQTNAIQAGTPYQTLRIYVPANIPPSGATIISCVGNLQTGTYPNQVNYSFNSAGTGGGSYMNAEHWGTGSLAGQTNPVFTFTIVYLLA